MKRRRYLIDDSVYPIFITTTIVYWIPVFSENQIAVKALELFEGIRAQMHVKICGYVLMQNHLHAIIQTAQKGDISALMRKWKSKTAIMILEICKNTHPEWMRRFAYSANRHRQFNSHQIWQPRFDEKAIRDEEEFIAKLNYMHGNPLKHNLVDDCGDYPYSSFADYNGGNNGFVSIECGHNKL
jgi:REP element-mobilizing transposase RayT